MTTPGAPAPRANPLTSVTAPAVHTGTQPLDGAARLREAFASVANQAVLRGAATGQIEVPELGRIAVHARSGAAGVDVDVTVDRPEARDVLRQHEGAMTVDLQRAEVPVARLAVDSPRSAVAHSPAAPSASSAGAGGSFGDGRRSARDERSTHDGDDTSGDHDERPTAVRSRVRIVL